MDTHLVPHRGDERSQSNARHRRALVASMPAIKTARYAQGRMLDVDIPRPQNVQLDGDFLGQVTSCASRLTPARSTCGWQRHRLGNGRAKAPLEGLRVGDARQQRPYHHGDQHVGGSDGRNGGL
jgi:hypothetical protein